MTLGQPAADWWEAHGAAVTRGGTLVVANSRDRAELRRFARRTSGFVEMDGDGVAALEPDLDGRFGLALHFPDEAHLAPRQALSALLARLEAKGVEVRFGVDGAEVDAKAKIVDCRGLAAGLPELRGVKGEMVIVRTPDVALGRPVRLLHPRHPLYIVPRGDGVFMLGATMIESDDRSRITARSLLELLGAAYALHPAFAEAEVLEIGVDARPAFPDNLPRAYEKDGRIYVNGLYRHGFLLSPAMAAEAAGLVAAALERAQ